MDVSNGLFLLVRPRQEHSQSSGPALNTLISWVNLKKRGKKQFKGDRKEYEPFLSAPNPRSPPTINLD
jgi:hypothetical protein